MGIICIIPARGGSKRVPGKNIRNFCGKPIIEYSINAAIESGLFEEIMVSTDSEKIAEIARNAGANVPFMRSAEASSDFATTHDVIAEVCGKYEEMGRTFDYIFCIYPAAPFVTAERLKEAYDLALSTGADYITPVCAFSSPPDRGYIIEDGYLKHRYPQFNACRTQDMIKVYHDCGQFYCWKYDVYLGKVKRTTHTVPLITPEELTQDIDNESDLRLAELKYRTFVLHEYD